jgi:hypothetical protein
MAPSPGRASSAAPGLIWAALTDPGQTAAYLYGLAALQLLMNSP